LKLNDEKRVDIARDLEQMRGLVLGESALEAITTLKNQDDLDFAEIRKNLMQKRRVARDAIRNMGTEVLQFLEANQLEIDDFSQKASGYGGYFMKMTEYPDKVP